MAKSSVKKKLAPRPANSAARAAKPTAKPSTKPAAKSRALSSSGGEKKSPKKRAAAAPTLGRPLITAEEKLYLLFKEDYHARQIFEFLRVESVGDLEKFSPDQIVKLLSKPIRTTVERIRQKLAEKNRHLLDDTDFALAHLARTAASQP